MKNCVLIAVLTLAIGIGLLITGTISSREVALFGLTFSSRIVQGVGLISMIFGVVTILTAVRSIQPHTRADRRNE
jgi:hypothetical protein